MRFSHAGASDVGRKRTHNEDAFLLLPEESLYCVADGMGGHASGEVAARIAVEEMAEAFRLTGVKRANLRIHERAGTDAKLHGMGTTIVAAASPREGNAALIGHVGDSRAYLFRRSELRQLTEDHSLLNEHLKAHALSPAEVK